MKKLLASILFIFLVFISIDRINEIAVEKTMNRVYMLSDELAAADEIFDVDVFGSCHAYTSFDPIQFQEKFGYTAFNMANPSEIIPISYIRMAQQFRRQKPKVVLVDIWGVNIYDTYIAPESILGPYAQLNMSVLPISREKMEVIQSFDEFDGLNLNFALASYKDRILDLDLHEYDFDYSNQKQMYEFQDTESSWYQSMLAEMFCRLTHNGGLLGDVNPLSEFDSLQPDVGSAETQIEPNIMEYVDKIIQLCEESDVKLIFYRAPYIVNATERQKTNYLARYLSEKGVPFYDLEEEIAFDIETDFTDLYHLSELGCRKSTAFLGKIAADAMAS